MTIEFIDSRNGFFEDVKALEERIQPHQDLCPKVDLRIMQGIEKVFVTLQTRIMSDNIEKANFGGELLKHREEFETRNRYDKAQ